MGHPEGTRTLNLRIDRPISTSPKQLKDKDLEKTQKAVYKELQNIASEEHIISIAMPSELVNLTEQWPNLPEHIRQTISRRDSNPQPSDRQSDGGFCKYLLTND